MADSITLTFDDNAFVQAGDRVVRQYLTAGTRAIGETTRRLEKRLEDATRSGVPGSLWKAWRSQSYPKSGPAKNPSGSVFYSASARTRGAMQFWTQPGEVRGKGGKYLAIPTPAAGNRGRGRNLTPREWEQKTGIKLRFVQRRGRAAVLVADGGTVQTARGIYTQFKPLTARRSAADQGRGFSRREVSAVIFVLIPAVRHRNTVSVEAVVAGGAVDLQRAYSEALAAVQGGQ